MEHSFWHERWESGRIGFHESRPNPLLVAHFPALSVPKGGRVFIPLCGKTLDIDWLLRQGHQVAGAELSERAIRELFERLGVGPVVSDLGDLARYSAPGIDIFLGDIFALTPDMLGSVDAVYDRAALVALPDSMRGSYASHVASITRFAPQLLVTFEYDQALFDGPPFSVDSVEVHRNYGAHHDPVSLASVAVAGGMKGEPARESVWLLRPR